MCGIAGIATAADRRLPDLRERLEAMAGAMLHRGPDDGGVYVSPAGLVGLANRRLAIRDLSPAGHMPMSTPDAAVTITYNGEIYNAPELRAELMARGFTFRSHSDTEVILLGYRLWGEDVVSHLRGMFAFGIHDVRQHRLFLARDPLGIKPLYVTHRGGRLAFASECKVLVRGALARADVSPAGLVAYLELGSIPAPLTIYRDIRALEAGQRLRVDLAGELLRIEQPKTYWRLPGPGRQTITYAEAAARVHDLLLDSVRRHLLSDVPLGVFLSGGLDSSAIVALMREASPGAAIRTCCVSFAEPEFDESPYARAVADYFATDHVEVRVTARDAAHHFDAAIAALDQPSNDGINTYFVSQSARKAGLTVSLSGIGGDELFGGYPSFQRLPPLLQAARAATKVPAGMATAQVALNLRGPFDAAARLAGWLQRGGATPTATYLGLRGLFSPAVVEQLVRPDVLAEARAEFDLLGAVGDSIGRPADEWDTTSRLEIAGYMRHQLLRDVDAMSMAHSLEVRVPFVDQAVVAGVLALPSALRARAPRKQLLRDAMPGAPALVRQRTSKQGFTFPFSTWMTGPLRGELHERVRSAATGLRDILDPEMALAALAAFDQGRTHWSRVWSLAALGTVFGNTGHSAVRPTTRAVRLPTTPSLGRVLGLFPTTELIGGIQTSGRIAWEGLSGNGHTTTATLVCYCASGAGSPRASTASTIHAGSKLAAGVAALRGRWDADLVLVWHVGLLKLLPFLHCPSARVAVFLHGIEVWEPLDRLARQLLENVDLLLTNSDYTWQRFVSANSAFATARHRTVPLGLGGVPLEASGPPDDRPAAVMISRLSGGERYKGHAEVIAAWPRVLARVPGAQLWIIGDGDLRPRLERRAFELGVHERVRFVGTVTEQRKQQLIRASRCLLLPSRKEGFGLVYLEAMRLGRPCLVSDTDAGKEVVNPPEAGLAVDVEDRPALAEAIARLLQNGAEREAWSRAAARRYASSFTAAHFQARLAAALAAP